MKNFDGTGAVERKGGEGLVNLFRSSLLHRQIYYCLNHKEKLIE